MYSSVQWAVIPDRMSSTALCLKTYRDVFSSEEKPSGDITLRLYMMNMKGVNFPMVKKSKLNFHCVPYRQVINFYV
jgi:hypothetical protein